MFFFHHSNIPVESLKSYFRITISNQILDDLILHLKDRFTKLKVVMCSLNILIILENDLISADENKLETLKETFFRFVTFIF